MQTKAIAVHFVVIFIFHSRESNKINTRMSHQTGETEAEMQRIQIRRLFPILSV